MNHKRQCSLVSVLQPSKRYKSKYLGFSVDRNEILWSQYLTCMKLCVLNFLWNMQCPRLAINSVKKENLLHSTKVKESWHRHKAIIILRYSTRGLSKTLLTFVFYHKGFNDRHLLLVPLCLFHPLSNSWPRGRRLCLYFPQARQTRIHTDTILQNSKFHHVSPSG